MATEAPTLAEIAATTDPIGAQGSQEAPASRTPAQPLTVLYDGECGVCRETIGKLRRWDHENRLEFVALQSAATSGRPILEKLAAEGRLEDAVHVVDESTGRVVAGGHAALAILDALPGGWLLRPWAVMPQTALAADVVYRVASRHRDRLAWLMGLRDDVHCPIDARHGAPDSRESID